MELYLQAIALVLIAVIMGLILKQQNKSMAMVVSVGACCMVCIGAVRFLEPVTELLARLRDLAGISSQTLSILLKAAGVGLLSELAALICTDAGETAMGKGIRILSNAVILWISLPLVEQLLSLLQEVLSNT